MVKEGESEQDQRLALVEVGHQSLLWWPGPEDLTSTLRRAARDSRLSLHPERSRGRGGGKGVRDGPKGKTRPGDPALGLKA